MIIVRNNFVYCWILIKIALGTMISPSFEIMNWGRA